MIYFHFLILCFCSLFLIPVYAGNLTYQLQIDLNPKTYQLVGIAKISSDADETLHLSISALSALKLNQNPISSSDAILNLNIAANQPITIEYTLKLDEPHIHHYVDENNVLLLDNWYPALTGGKLARHALTVTVPLGFIVNAEANTVRLDTVGEQQTYFFSFPYPLDRLNLMASKNYVLKTDNYKDIRLEAYFFKEDAELAEAYLAATKKYLNLYENLLTPYPYKRFAIVENPLPTGYSMPTYTLLGQAVIRLPFILDTSLGHEILHQWFGNSVYVNSAEGNWSEGLTTYLADHYYEALIGKGADYRKRLLIDYQAYITDKNVISAYEFKTRMNRVDSVIGYGKIAMLFHSLRLQLGETAFFAMLREFINSYQWQYAGWTDIQTVVEKQTNSSFKDFFAQWLHRKDILQLKITQPTVKNIKDQSQLTFTLNQENNPPYQLFIPLIIQTKNSEYQENLYITEKKQIITLPLKEPPLSITLDANYDVMRALVEEEMPPVLASLFGAESVLAVVSVEQQDLYQPLLENLRFNRLKIVTPENIKISDLSRHAVLIADKQNPLTQQFFGNPLMTADADMGLIMQKNPYHSKTVIGLLHLQNADSVKSARLTHYGEYSRVMFKQGKNIEKITFPSTKGIKVWRESFD